MGRRQQFYKFLQAVRKMLACDRRHSQSKCEMIDECSSDGLSQSIVSAKPLETIKEQSNDYEITFGTEDDEDRNLARFVVSKKPISKLISPQVFNRVQSNRRKRLCEINRQQQQQQQLKSSDQKQKVFGEKYQQIDRQKVFDDRLGLFQKIRQEEQDRKEINILDIKDSYSKKQPIQIHSEIQKIQDQVYKIQFLSKLKFAKQNKEDEKKNQSVDYSRLDLTDIKNQMSSAQNSQQSLEELVDFIK